MTTLSGVFGQRSRVIGVALVFMLLAPAAMAEEIKIGGTGNALGTARLLGEAFSKQHPNVKVTVISSLGSSGAIKAVPKGAIDIGLTSRPLTDEERAAGIKDTEYARSPTVLAVPAKSKVTALTHDQLADIYTGKLATWPDGSSIRPIMRQPGDDNTRQVSELSPAIDKALVVAEQRPGLAFATTDQDAAEKMESTPGALGVSTLALINSEGRQLRPLALDGVEPSVKNASSGKYPLFKKFFFITKPIPSTAAQQFMAFVGTPAGREILTQTGHWVP